MFATCLQVFHMFATPGLRQSGNIWPRLHPCLPLAQTPTGERRLRAAMVDGDQEREWHQRRCPDGEVCAAKPPEHMNASKLWLAARRSAKNMLPLEAKMLSIAGTNDTLEGECWAAPVDRPKRSALRDFARGVYGTQTTAAAKTGKGWCAAMET